MESKKWYHSLVLWFNVALIIVGAVEQLANYIPIPPDVLGYIGAIGNFLLRFKTTMPVTK